MSSTPPTIQPATQQPKSQSSLRRHRSIADRLTVVGVIVLVLATIVLVSPIIPVKSEYTFPNTRTVNLHYNATIYSIGNVPLYVNVTNNDSIGGNFSVTMNKFHPRVVGIDMRFYLTDTFTQSQYIAAGATCKYKLPDDWYIIHPMNEFTYSVAAPTKQEDYDVIMIETKFKSVLELIQELL